jgi:hypothetical protein
MSQMSFSVVPEMNGEVRCGKREEQMEAISRIHVSKHLETDLYASNRTTDEFSCNCQISPTSQLNPWYLYSLTTSRLLASKSPIS